MSTVLFVSNGYGEDAIACGIVERLQDSAPTARLLAMPLVGEGSAYRRLGVEVVGPRRLMPSGGLILARWANLLRDLRAGLWDMTREQIRTILRLRSTLGAYVAVGDTYPTLLGGLFSGRRVVMVGTAKSDWFCSYSWLERQAFRTFCEVVFVRDEPTAATLRAHGVAARWVGNGMMDLLAETGEPLPLANGAPAVAILPGSRQSAYRDLPYLLDAVRRLGATGPYGWMMPLADSLDLRELAASASAGGWSLAEEGGGGGVEGWLRGHGQEVLLVRGRFGDVLHRAALVIGQAGTGNEQAAGLGRPVVSFDSDGGRRPGWYRARQMGLLGGAMAVVPRSGEHLAEEARRILSDPVRYRAMQRIGYERMGPPGASAQIAHYILQKAGTKK